MKGRSLLALAVLSLALACEGNQQPTGPNAPVDASKIISDGAHGGNREFFFLPPLLPLPTTADGFEPGEFNNAIGPSLTVEICRLKPDKLDNQQLPTPDTPCYENGPFWHFGPGMVQLVSNPGSGTGWWRAPGLTLPVDGFYYVMWDTREAHLNAEKFYRVKVFIAGSNVPLGVADIDPMKKETELQSSALGQVIQVLNGVMLPIPFRVENHALCEGATECTSATVTNESPTGSQSVVVDAGGGSIAGAKFPNGWLPQGGPQSVVVTVSEVNVTGDGGDLTALATVCHPGIPFQQFRGCFNYSTTPALQPFNEAGDQFAEPVTVAVCFELEGKGDPREKFAELYASGPNEPAHALEDVPDGGLLGVTTKDCSAEPIITQSSNPLLQLASTGWRRVKGGLGRLFGVKTAYAVDLGLGGIVKGFSNIGAVLPAHLEAEGATDLGTQPAGTRYILNVMAMGSNHHGAHTPGGIGGVPVTFSVASVSQGTVEQHFTDVGTVTPVSVESITRDDSETRGEASAIWQLPSEPGTYHLTVTAKATGSPITFTATVPTPTAGLVSFDSPDIGESYSQVVNPYTDATTGIVFSAGPSGAVGISRNFTSGTSVCVVPEDGNQKLGTAPVGSPSIGFGTYPIKATFPTTLPAGTLVSVEVQTGAGDGTNVVQLRFLDGSGTEVASITQPVPTEPDLRCEGAPGPPRAKLVLFTTVNQAFKQVVVVGPAGTVFVIDNLQFATSASFD